MRSTLTPSVCLIFLLLSACMQTEKKATPAPGAEARPPESTADRIYSDGALAEPEPKAADLGMAPPDSKITLDPK